MKKFGIVLALVLVCTCLMSVCAFAAGNSFSVSAKESVEPGEEFTVKVDLSTEGILLLQLSVSYDSSAFEFVSKNIDGFVPNNTTAVDGDGVVNFSLGDDLSTDNITGTGTVATITFKAKTDAEGKSGAFTANASYACDADFTEFDITDGTATVKVEGAAATEPPAETEAPATEPPAETEAPATEPPAETEAPATEPPAETEAPATEPPAETEAPATEPPAETEAPHVHEWDNGTVKVPATATEDGVGTRTCKICGETEDYTIPKTGGEEQQGGSGEQGNNDGAKKDGNNNTKKNDNPKTGDATNVAIYAGILVLCGAATVAVVSKKKNHG